MPTTAPVGHITIAAYARWVANGDPGEASRIESRTRKALYTAARRGDPLPPHVTDPHTGKRRYEAEPLREWMKTRPRPGRRPQPSANHISKGTST